MARPAPGPIPARHLLPDLDKAAGWIEHVVNAPRIRLGDARIRDLIEAYNDGTPVWLTGSSVWLPAVYGQNPPVDNDFDIIFSTKAACDRFIAGALAELNRRIPGYNFERGHTALGATRILPPSGSRPLVNVGNLFKSLSGSGPSVGIIDAWALEPGESVAEILMSYPEAHQRCAYLMNRSVAGSGAALTRIVAPVKKENFTARYRR